jgi:hypothetical protein
MGFTQELLFVGFTNGFVRVYSFDGPTLHLRTETKVHDFGVNCLALTEHEGSVVVLTGGDD